MYDVTNTRFPRSKYMPPRIIPTWRSSGARERARSTLRGAQYERFSKIYEEPFFLVRPPETSDFECTFCVSGSSQTAIYKVEIGLFDGKTKCTCMDAKINCRKHKCVCKHVCFVLFRVLSECVGLEFFRGEVEGRAPRDPGGEGAGEGAGAGEGSMRLSAQQIYRMLDRVKSLCDNPSSHDILSPIDVASEAYRTQNKSVFRRKENFRELTEDSECPVCFLPFEPKDDDILRGCPSCGNVIHLECMRRWAQFLPSSSLNATMNKNVTCVICRSDVWRLWDGQ